MCGGCTTISEAMSICLSSPLTVTLVFLRDVLGGVHTFEELLSKVTPRNSVPIELRRDADL